MKKEEKRQQTIFGQLVEAMEERGLYDESLDPAITMLASVMELYEQAHEAVGKELLIVQTSREGEKRVIINPAFQAESVCAEQIRKYMRDLGLVVAKPSGMVSREKDTRPRPGDKLVALMETMEAPRPRLYRKKAAK